MGEGTTFPFPVPPCQKALCSDDWCFCNVRVYNPGGDRSEDTIRRPTHLQWQLSLLTTIPRNPGTDSYRSHHRLPALSCKCAWYAAALHNADTFDAVYHEIPTQLKELLVEPRQQSTRNPSLPLYLIVVDALDEINGEGGTVFLRDLLTAIDEYNLRGFKFPLTSRPDSAVVYLCKSFTPEAVRWLFVGSNEYRSRRQSWTLGVRTWMSLGDGQVVYSFTQQWWSSI